MCSDTMATPPASQLCNTTDTAGEPSLNNCGPGGVKCQYGSILRQTLALSGSFKALCKRRKKKLFFRTRNHKQKIVPTIPSIVKKKKKTKTKIFSTILF